MLPVGTEGRARCTVSAGDFDHHLTDVFTGDRPLCTRHWAGLGLHTGQNSQVYDLVTKVKLVYLSSVMATIKEREHGKGETFKGEADSSLSLECWEQMCKSVWWLGGQ